MALPLEKFPEILSKIGINILSSPSISGTFPLYSAQSRNHYIWDRSQNNIFSVRLSPSDFQNLSASSILNESIHLPPWFGTWRSLSTNNTQRIQEIESGHGKLQVILHLQNTLMVCATSDRLRGTVGPHPPCIMYINDRCIMFINDWRFTGSEGCYSMEPGCNRTVKQCSEQLLLKIYVLLKM